MVRVGNNPLGRSRIRRVSPFKPVVVSGIDFLAILDTFGEVMYWHSQEWDEDPDVLQTAKTTCLAVLAVGDTLPYRKRWNRPPAYDTAWGTTTALLRSTIIIKPRNYKNMMEHLRNSSYSQLGESVLL